MHTIRSGGVRCLLAGALLAASLAAAQAQAAAPTAAQQAHATQLLQAAPLVDGHNDWAFALRLADGPDGARTASLDQPAAITLADGTRLTGQTSVPWLKAGRVGIQLWSVFVPARLAPDEAVRQSFEQIAIVRSFARRDPALFRMVTTAAEARAAWRQGQIAGLLAMEGAHQVADDIPTLRRAYAAGVRSLTLAHSRPTALFDSATAPPRWHGMAPAGAAFIAEMNRLGMLVDLAHVSPDVMNQVLDVTRAPVIFSHSSARALTDHPRNVPDEVLRRLRANGGVVMVTFVPAFIDQARADWERARDAAVAGITGADARAAALARHDAAHPRPVSTLQMVADHIDHVARVAGHAHVGIGSDYDGTTDMPAGLENVSCYPALFAELVRRGWSDADLRQLAGGNFLRVLEQVETVAARLPQSADPRP